MRIRGSELLVCTDSDGNNAISQHYYNDFIYFTTNKAVIYLPTFSATVPPTTALHLLVSV